MIKRLNMFKCKKSVNKFKINFIITLNFKNVCSNIETFDESKASKLIIPIKIYDPLFPFSNSSRYFAKEDPGIMEIIKQYKDDNENSEKYAAFLYDKKKKKFLSTGVECNLINLESTGEISIISKKGDKRVQLIYPDKIKFEGELSEVIEIKDKESANRLINNDLAKNIISDINRVIINCLGLVTKPMTMMDNTLMRDLSSILIHLQSLMQGNNEFILNSNSQQIFYPEGLNRLNFLIYKNIQEILRISKTIRKYTPFNDTEEFLKCEDPLLRTKLLIDFIYHLGDYMIKEMHMYEEYKKDTIQKQEKFYLRFAKKTVDKLSGSDNYDNYHNKLENLLKNNEITSQTHRSIQIELEQANSRGDEGFDFEDRKKYSIVEEIFNFPWDKRDEVDYDILNAKKVFDNNLYGMDKVKERVYEYIAKLKRTRKLNKKGFVILVTGPPGTGKTTVATLIGQALKRKTGIINLSGESDNITLKGSKRTYVDAQPSIFFKEIIKLGVKNPVIVLDEVDKLSGSTGYKSQTAASALLELLNPEENHNFIDQYLNIPLDFSETIFICTANYTMQMLEPLLDRIEVIEIDDYTFQDKKDIVEKFIIPKTKKEFGYQNEIEINNTNSSLVTQTIEFPEETIVKLIKHYSSPAGGVRGIKKNIEKIIRRANLYLISNKSTQTLLINEMYLNKFLGNTKTYDVNFVNLVQNYNYPGTILTADLKGYLVKIIIKRKITGSNDRAKSALTTTTSSKDILQKVNMIFKFEKHVEEALHISINLARNKLVDIFNWLDISNLQKNLLSEYNIYMTTPYLKKHGNSYGLALYISLISSVLNTKLHFNDILVVGELSPRGNILKVRGIKHFLSICEFYEIKNLMLPEGNREEFNKYIAMDTTGQGQESKFFKNVFFVKTADEAFEILLTSEIKKMQMELKASNYLQSDDIVNSTSNMGNSTSMH